MARVDSEQRTVAVDRGKRRDIRILADRRNHRIGMQLELAALDRHHRELAAPRARFEADADAGEHDGAVCRHRRAHHRPCDERNALLPCFGDFVALRGHLLDAFEGDDGDVVSGTARRARDVDRRAAAADDDDTRAERRRGADARRGEVARSVDDVRLRVVERRQAFRSRCSDRDVNRVELPAQTIEVGGCSDRLRARDVDAERDDARDLGVEHRAREPIRGDAVAHQAAELGLRLEQCHAVTVAAQMKRGRQPGRSAADDGDALVVR